MCQAYEGEAAYIRACERSDHLRQIESHGSDDYHRGVPKSAHLHAGKTRQAPLFYTDTFLRSDGWYGDEIRAWERGWDRVYHDSGDHDRDVARTIGIQ